MSFSIYSKKDYERAQNSIGYHTSVDFGNKILVEFQKSNVGTYIDLQTALQSLIKDFFEQQNQVIEKNKSWANIKLAENILSKKDLEELEEKSKNFKKNLLVTSIHAKDIYPDIFKLVRDKSLEINLFTLFDEKIFKDYKNYLNILFEKSNEIYDLAKKIEEFLKKENKHFIENKKMYLKLYESDKGIYFSTLSNIKSLRKKCKFPGNVTQIEFKEDYTLLKEDLIFHRDKLKEFQEWLVQEELVSQRNKNFQVTGFLETNEEKTLREELEKKEKEALQRKSENNKIKFQQFIERLKKLEQMLENEIKNVFPVKYESLINELKILQKLSFELFILDIEDKLRKLNNLQDNLNDLEFEINQPNKTISEFLNDSRKKILIIEGMAGTGKTSKILNILSDQLNNKIDVKSINALICAPSTVAAANIRQRFKIKTFTFQSIIKPNQIFNYNLTNTDNDLNIFIVDESNMLTTTQLSAMFKYFRHNFNLKFIFIGDSGQINAYDFDNKNSEESPALNVENLIKISNFQRVQIEYIYLEIDYRFFKTENPKEFISALKWLRSDLVKIPDFINFKEKLSNLFSIIFEEVKNNNIIIEHFNRNLSIEDYISSKLDSGQEIDVDRLIKKFDLTYEISEIRDAIEIYKNPMNRRPELGKIYSSIFPNVKRRIANPEEVDSSIILRRSKEGVLETNKSMRPYLFEKDKTNLNKVEVGELLFINKAPKNSKEYNFKTNIDEGDLVVVTKIDKRQDLIDKSVMKISVKPVIKKTDTWLQMKFKQFDDLLKNLNMSLDFLSERSISIWTGNLNKVDDYEEWNNYINLIDDSDSKYLSPYLVTYGYTKTFFTAQGGEWDNVFIHEGDIWSYNNNIKEQKKYLYTATTRATRKIWFTN